MKCALCFGLLVAFLHSCASINFSDEFAEQTSGHASFLEVVQEESRGKCTERSKDCTHDRHSCCRSKIFKDSCECIKSKTGEKCSCQQQKYKKIIEDYLGEIPALPKPEDDKCVKNHHDCSQRKNDCCSGSLFQYRCKCYNLIEDDGKESEICGCVSPPEHQALAQSFRWMKAIYKKIG